MVAGLRSNRDFCVAALAALPGVTVPEPGGAFYLFPRIDGVEDSFAFCRELLLEERVGIAPGRPSAWAAKAPCGSATRPTSVLEPALERLSRFL